MMAAGRRPILRAPEVVLAMCDRVVLNGKELSLTPDRHGEIVDAFHQLAGRGERGLGCAERACDRDGVPEDGYVFLGLTGMIDPPSP
jgi:sodium/potassium-transporting ATPase subunit alpha